MTFNIEGTKNVGSVVELVNKYNLDVILLQEVWLRTYNVATKLSRYLKNYHWLTKLPDSQLHIEDILNVKNLSYHGVALGVRRDLFDLMEEVHVENRNIIAIKQELAGKTHLIINAYLPTRGKDDNFKKALADIGNVLANNESVERIVIAGDLNVDVDSSDKRIVAWLDFLAEHELEDHVTGISTHTHHVSNNSNELDRFVTRGVKRLAISLQNTDSNGSDHSPVMASMLIEAPPAVDEALGAPIESKVNIQKLLQYDEDFKRATDDLADILIDLQEEHDFDTDVFTALLEKSVFKLAIEFTEQREFQSQKPRRPKKIKIDPQAYKDVRLAKKRFCLSGKRKQSEEHQELKRARVNLRRKLRNAVEEEESNLNEQIISLSGTSQVFKVLKKMRQAHTTDNTMPSRIEGYEREYEKPNVLRGFQDLFEIQTTLDFLERYDENSFNLAKLKNQVLRDIIREQGEEISIDFNENEFAEIVKGLKGGKAQDVFGMSNDLLKMSGEKMKDLIFAICKQTLDEADVKGLLRAFGKGTLIFKKPGKPVTKVNHWRKIQTNNRILDVCQKKVQSSIEKKVRQIQTEFQLGFTAGIPIVNGVVLREELKSLARYMKRTIFFGVLDLASCFPSICREQLLSMAAEILTPAEWTFLDQIYTDTYGEIRLQGQRSGLMTANRGTVEGGLLSPDLLKLFLSILLTLLKKAGFTAEVDFNLGIVSPGQVAIADDVLLWCYNSETLRCQLQICEYWTNLMRATFSAQKSKVVICRAPQDLDTDFGDFYLYGEKLEIVDRVEHLGVPIGSGNTNRAVVELRAMKTRRAMHGTISYYNPRGILNIATKIELWKKTYRSVAKYSLDTNDLAASDVAKVELIQTKALRAILRMSTRAKISLIRLLVGSMTIASEVWKLRLGVLQGILAVDSIVRDHCLMILLAEVEDSWSYRTVKKLTELLGEESLDPYDILARPRDLFKEDIKAIIRGQEIRKLVKEVHTSPIHRVPVEPFKTIHPLLLTDFSYKSQRHARSFSALYCADFTRNYSKPCFICGSEKLTEEELQERTDNTLHILSSNCVVSRVKQVVKAKEDIKDRLAELRPGHPVSTEVCSDLYWARWILNPTCITLGSHSLTPTELQVTRLDDLIRCYAHKLIKTRYKLLKSCGVILRSSGAEKQVKGSRVA